METAVNSELAATNMRVVERAEVPRRPSQPNVPVNLALGLIGGTILALGAAFVCDYFDNSVKSSDEVCELLQLPTLATIPNFALARGAPARSVRRRCPRRPGLADARHGRAERAWSPVAEAFAACARRSRSHVDAPRGHSRHQRAGERGKPSIRSTWDDARGGRLAGLLIDVDLRHPGAIAPSVSRTTAVCRASPARSSRTT
jgi:hypothetical protein